MRICKQCRWTFQSQTPDMFCNDCARQIKAQLIHDLTNPQPQINIKDIMRHKYWALQMKWAIEDDYGL